MSKVRIEKYESKGNQPSRWANRAEGLLVSADLLAKHTSLLDPNDGSAHAPDQKSVEVRIFPVVLMLRAMAVECLLKAMWLKSGRVLFEKGKYRSIPNTKPHDLVLHADAVAPLCGMAFSEPERSVLGRLTLFNARGRYPSQVNWQINAPETTPHGLLPPTYWFPHEDEHTYSALVAKCKAVL